MKTVMVLMLVAVLIALAGAGMFMLRKGRTPGETNRAMARALALRVGLSVALFPFLSKYMLRQTKVMLLMLQ